MKYTVTNEHELSILADVVKALSVSDVVDALYTPTYYKGVNTRIHFCTKDDQSDDGRSIFDDTSQVLTRNNNTHWQGKFTTPDSQSPIDENYMHSVVVEGGEGHEVYTCMPRLVYAEGGYTHERIQTDTIYNMLLYGPENVTLECQTPETEAFHRRQADLLETNGAFQPYTDHTMWVDIRNDVANGLSNNGIQDLAQRIQTEFEARMDKYIAEESTGRGLAVLQCPVGGE